MGDRDHKKSKKSKDKKKDRKRRRSETPSSSSSDDEDRRRRDAAKLAKKVERHLKKHDTAVVGYTNDDNPFGDANLTERFVWGKKIEKQLEQGMDVRDLTIKAEKRRQLEREEEIEKVKRRREEREAEREAMKEELEMIQRERAMAEAVELEKKEEEFHLEQAKVRARQRLAAGRPKAIDLLTNNLFLLDGFDATEEDPVAIISSLTLYQLKDLKKDLEEYAELDARNTSHKDFWTSLQVVTEHELGEALKQEEIDKARMRGLPPPEKYQAREAGWHSSIDDDVAGMFAGQTHSKLIELEANIQHQLDSGEAADPEYWVAVLRRLQIHKSKARLREFHADMMQRQLDKIMSGVDVPQAMGWRERAAQAEEEAQRAQHEAEQEEQRAAAEHVQPPPEAAPGVAAESNAEEIELPDEEEVGGGAGPGPSTAAAMEEDAELLALAAVDNRPRPDTTTASQENDAAVAAERTVRGEPRTWEDMSDDEQDQQDDGAGQYSPRPLAPEHVAAQDVVHESDDLKMLELLRMQVKVKEAERFKAAAAAAAAAGGSASASADADRMYRQMVANPRSAGFVLGATNPLMKFIADAAPQRGELAMRAGAAEVVDLGPDESRLRSIAAQNMGDLNTSGDAPFGGEINLDSQVYWWHEKYKPRKPKYFNRVHTGYEWNKYNKTHYDADNPPPKTVQGYKFNIFYPDLIDKVKAPTYKVEKDPSSEDGSTCILRFTAGPPYEDIAFRIVNKEWEYNHKKGFKCVFDRGILHLYFNFRRQFYRR